MKLPQWMSALWGKARHAFASVASGKQADAKERKGSEMVKKTAIKFDGPVPPAPVRRSVLKIHYRAGWAKEHVRMGQNLKTEHSINQQKMLNLHVAAKVDVRKDFNKGSGRSRRRGV